MSTNNDDRVSFEDLMNGIGMKHYSPFGKTAENVREQLDALLPEDTNPTERLMMLALLPAFAVAVTEAHDKKYDPGDLWGAMAYCIAQMITDTVGATTKPTLGAQLVVTKRIITQISELTAKATLINASHRSRERGEQGESHATQQ